MDRFNNCVGVCLKDNDQKLNSPITQDDFQKIVGTHDLVRMLDRVKYICDPKKRITSPKPYDMRTLFDEDADYYKTRATGQTIRPARERAQKIKAELNKGLKEAQPVGIGFCSEVLRPETNATQVYGMYAAGAAAPANCGRHAALIVGKRWNKTKNRCEFMLQNSWFPKCRSSGSSTDPKTAGYNYDYECASATDDRVWIPETRLSEATFQAHVLEPARHN